jgi:large subunit ribosomal protein L10
MELAFNKLGLPMPEGASRGTTAIGFAMEDVPPVAKAIVELRRAGQRIDLKGGLVDGNLYDAAQMERLADLPPMPVVRAQLLGLLNTPARQVAGTLAGALRQVMGVLQAYSQRESAESA